MHNTIKNLIDIKNKIKVHIAKLNIKKVPTIVAVSKTFKIDKVLPLIEYGHTDYGENKVQEALEKWTDIKKKNSQIKLHMIGRLQTNKVKFAVQIFDYIHSLDNKKFSKKLLNKKNKIKKKIKIFLQVNIGNESQKSGINKTEVKQLVNYSKKIGLDVIGLMCIPPAHDDPENYFEQMNKLNNDFGFSELSMGMSSDFLIAVKHSSTFVRVGSNIFGQRI